MRVETRLRRAVMTREKYCLAWWPHTAFLLVLVRRLQGLKTVLTGTTNLGNPLYAKRRLRHCLTRLSISLATGTILVSQAEAAALNAKRTRNHRVIPHSVDLEKYLGGPEPSERPSGIMIAQINPASILRKGVAEAIESVAQIRQVMPEFVFHLVGPITEEGRPALEAILARAGAGGIIVHGEVAEEEKIALLHQAWVYIQPSRFEGFGLAVLEGMAAGCWPIVSGAGALSEVVDGVGKYLAIGYPGAVAQAVVDACAHGLLEKRRTLAVERASYYSFENKVQRMGGFLQAMGIPIE